MFVFSLILFTFCFANCKVTAQFNNQKESKPLNVVLILTDDQGYHLSAVNTKGISTPNLDELAKNGMLFTNSFAVTPSCSPSRSSIMSGMFPHANGHWRNTVTPELSDPDSEFGRNSKTVDQVGIHEYIITLPELLQQNGYFTAITQKFHMSPPWKFPYTARDPVQSDPEKFKEVISKFIADAGDRPFFFQANIAAPHRNYDGHIKKFPNLIPNPYDIEVPKYLVDTPAMRADLAKYFGSVQVADSCAGAIIETLREKGLLENTLIIYTGDQGEPYHRAKASPYYAGLHVPFIAAGPEVLKAKVSNELISHIDIMPTILDYLKIPIPKTVQGHSLKPIFSGTSKNQIDRPYVLGEHNSHGPARNEHYPSRMVYDGRYYYIQNLMHGKDYELPADLKEEKGWGNHSYQATLDARDSHPIQFHLLKELESGRPFEELYDMENDPGQLHNLAGTKALKSKQAELKTVLENWRKDTGDIADDPLEIKTRQFKE